MIGWTPGLGSGLGEFQRAEQIAGVGDGDRRHALRVGTARPARLILIAPFRAANRPSGCADGRNRRGRHSLHQSATEASRLIRSNRSMSVQRLRSHVLADHGDGVRSRPAAVARARRCGPCAGRARDCGWRSAPRARSSRTSVDQLVEHAARRCAGRDCRSARRPAAGAARWRGRGRSRRAAARRPTAAPAGGRARSARPTRASSSRRALCAAPRAARRRSSAAASRSRARRTPAAGDGTGRRSRCRRGASRVRVASSQAGAVAGRRCRPRPPSAARAGPAMCSSVDLPAPDGPTSATISPGSTVKSRRRAARRARAPACLEAAGDDRAARARDAPLPSLIAQRLDRIEPRGPPGRIERRQERQHQRHQRRPARPRRVDLGRHAASGNRSRPGTARCRSAAAANCRIALDVDGRTARRARSRASVPTTPIAGAGHEEDAQDRAARRAHGAQDGDVVAPCPSPA